VTGVIRFLNTHRRNFCRDVSRNDLHGLHALASVVGYNWCNNSAFMGGYKRMYDMLACGYLSQTRDMEVGMRLFNRWVKDRESDEAR